MLAPMEDFTDAAYRTLAYMCGCDITFTEMVSLEGLMKGVSNTFQKIIIPDDTPTFIQIVGNKESSLELFLKNFKPVNGFKGFNLNLGCPNPDIIRKGMGAAMIKRVTKVNNMVTIIKKYGYPVSIKMRLGLSSFEKENKVYLKLIQSVDADFFIVHARHGKETYDDKADFSVFGECVATGKIIIANGDIKTPEQVEYLKSIGVKGVMIGRAATCDPRIFSRLKGGPIPKLDAKQVYLRLCERFSSPARYRNNVFKRLIV